jgi:hypothetical protein
MIRETRETLLDWLICRRIGFNGSWPWTAAANRDQEYSFSVTLPDGSRVCSEPFTIRSVENRPSHNRTEAVPVARPGPASRRENADLEELNAGCAAANEMMRIDSKVTNATEMKCRCDHDLPHPK